MNINNNKIENILIDKLNFLPFNRSINTEQVNKLMGSLESFGKLRLPVIVHTSVIDGTPKYYIVDGQHMVSSLMRFNEDKVQCIVFESNDKYEIVSIMATLNNIVCTWSFKDYINAYASLGDSNYLRLRAHYKTTGFTPSISSEVLGNRAKVRKGEFVISNTDADELYTSIALLSFIGLPMVIYLLLIIN
jgi:hypothetical protein